MGKKSIITRLETHLIRFVCPYIYTILFLLFVKINVAFLSPPLLLCTFVLLWLLSALFTSDDDEIRTVYGSTLSSAAPITAAIASLWVVPLQQWQLHMSVALVSQVAG